MLSEMVVELLLAPEWFGSLRTGVVPFALYVHWSDLASAPALWKKISRPVMKSLKKCHDRALGDEYERVRPRVRALERAEGPLLLAKESGVIVLGHDSGRDLAEMERVSERLRSMEYDARLIREMVDIPTMSNEEKVRLWTMAARFSVMIDRTPSGHIAEHVFAQGQRTILAVLRPHGTGSTYMIGDAGLVDVNYVKVFEFDYYPEDVLEEAVKWAETHALARQQAYASAYPWRSENKGDSS